LIFYKENKDLADEVAIVYSIVYLEVEVYSVSVYSIVVEGGGGKRRIKSIAYTIHLNLNLCQTSQVLKSEFSLKGQ
jgi:hypothetical protein